MNGRKMKGTLLIILVFLGSISRAQNPFEQTSWAASSRIEAAFDELILHPADTANLHASYYHLDFKPGQQFLSYNVPGCGMDCVVQINGNYEVTGNTIRFVITAVNRYKRCSAPQEIKEEPIGTYYWIQDEFALRIVKDLGDEPAENYFEKLEEKPPVFKDKKANYLIRKYVYTYNRYYRVLEQKKEKRYEKMKAELEAWRIEASSHKIKETTQNEYYQRAVSELYQILHNRAREAG